MMHWVNGEKREGGIIIFTQQPTIATTNSLANATTTIAYSFLPAAKKNVITVVQERERRQCNHERGATKEPTSKREAQRKEILAQGRSHPRAR